MFSNLAVHDLVIIMGDKWKIKVANKRQNLANCAYAKSTPLQGSNEGNLLNLGFPGSNKVKISTPTLLSHPAYDVCEV